MGVIMMGVSNANAGIIVNAADTDTKSSPCEQGDYDKDWGIIVNLTGIIVNLTGIIVNFKVDEKETVDCGIIVN